jgi:hypothetical protein
VGFLEQPFDLVEPPQDFVLKVPITHWIPRCHASSNSGLLALSTADLKLLQFTRFIVGTIFALGGADVNSSFG